VSVETVSFEAHECVRLDSGGTSAYVTTSVGPRVLGFVGPDVGNVMAILPDAALDLADGGRFRLFGGHRLWAAPELPEVTYQPDEHPCNVHEVDGGVRVEAPVDGAGFAKSIEVRADGDGWLVDHVVRNASGAAATIAPWAVTQVRLGGRVHLPLGPRGDGLQASHSLVLWPYTDPSDPRIGFSADEVVVDARPAGPRLKLGAAPSTGRVAYVLEGMEFGKHIRVEPDEPHADRGAAVQVYLCDEFCEMETLGPLRELRPGEAARHRERWTLRPVGGEEP
jgi:hypothetical protein